MPIREYRYYVKIYEYNRQAAVSYALFYAKKRNPKYYNFDNIGGDCTNFASQSIYAGSGVMNFDYPFGWFYKSAYSRSPSWTSVEALQNFLLQKEERIGPFGELVSIEKLEIGDVVQIKNYGIFTHTLVITKIEGHDPFNIFVCAHTSDAFNRRLSTYNLEDAKFIKIKGVIK